MAQRPILKGRFKRIRSVEVTKENLDAVAELLGIRKGGMATGSLHIVQEDDSASWKAAAKRPKKPK